MNVLIWIKDNYVIILEAAMALVVAAEVITRLTPTKKDDGFVERIGGIIRKTMDLLKIPNIKKP